MKKSKERPSTSQKKYALMEQITAFVDANLTEKLTLKGVSSYCNVSVSTVTQLFQKRASMTFHDFVTHRRMEMVRKLIQEDMPLEQIGKAVGYRDHSTFYRAFRKYFKVSPREYRIQVHSEKNI